MIKFTKNLYTLEVLEIITKEQSVPTEVYDSQIKKTNSRSFKIA